MEANRIVASLGGNLSLFLGASFLALIHIIVFFLKLPFEHANAAVPPSSAPAAQSTSVQLPLSRRQQRDALEQKQRNAAKRLEFVIRQNTLVVNDALRALQQIQAVSRRHRAAEQRRNLLRDAFLY